MRKLPTNDRELNRIVFQNAGVSEGRSINDYFNLKEICTMLENGNFSQCTRDWLYYAVDHEMIKLGY